MPETKTKEQLLAMSKKQIINYAGYRNMRHLMDSDMYPTAPSRKQLIRDLL